MKYFRSYNLPPSAPFALPISAHPPAVPCSAGKQLAEGAYVSRGGVFEGPSMSDGDSHCGYWSDYVGEVPLYHQGYPPSRPAGPFAVREVPAWPPELPARFQPRDLQLGYPLSPVADGQLYEAAALSGMMGGRRQRVRRRLPPPCGSPPLRPCPPMPASGFGQPPVGHQSEVPVDPMYMIVNRHRNVWTGPMTERQTWPVDYTPKGGVLDGNTIQYRGQGVSSAYYYGESPQVLQPVETMSVLPNPLDQEPVPTVGWGISGMGEYYTPGQNGGAQEAQLPRKICPSIGTSIFAGAVPGDKVLAKSIFDTSVYETRSGDVPAKLTVNPAVDAVPATASAQAVQACSGCGSFGAGPDGLGRFVVRRGVRRARRRR